MNTEIARNTEITNLFIEAASNLTDESKKITHKDIELANLKTIINKTIGMLYTYAAILKDAK